MVKLRDILNEIGGVDDTTTNAYPYRLVGKLNKIKTDRQTDELSIETRYTFKTSDGEKYAVIIGTEVEVDYTDDYDEIYVPGSEISITFGTVDQVKSDEYTATNKGLKEALKVMATVVEITKDYINKTGGIKVIKFSAAGKDSDNRHKKHKIYNAYVKKHFPNAVVDANEYGGTKVTLK
jgi:hypothetical protein